MGGLGHRVFDLRRYRAGSLPVPPSFASPGDDPRTPATRPIASIELELATNVSSEGDGTRLRMEVLYQPRAFPASLLALLFRFGFGRRLPGTLRAIKEVAEAER